MNFRDFLATESVVDGGYQVVAEYRFYLKGNAPSPLGVKILRDCQGNFRPLLSHFVHGSGLAGPQHPSCQPYQSAEEALEEAFLHGLMDYDPQDPDAEWEPNQSF